MYHHIIYICDFFVNLDDFFAVICTSFHEVVVCTRYIPIYNRLTFPSKKIYNRLTWLMKTVGYKSLSSLVM